MLLGWAGRAGAHRGVWRADFASFGGIALILFGAMMLLPQRLSPFRLLAPAAGQAADQSARAHLLGPAHFGQWRGSGSGMVAMHRPHHVRGTGLHRAKPAVVLPHHGHAYSAG